MVDTDGDGITDTTFGDIIAEVELILGSPDPSDGDLERAKDLAEAVNLHDQNNPDCVTGTGTGTGTGSSTGTGTRQ